jgi:hypothetical protein
MMSYWNFAKVVGVLVVLDTLVSQRRECATSLQKAKVGVLRNHEFFVYQIRLSSRYKD